MGENQAFRLLQFDASAECAIVGEQVRRRTIKQLVTRRLGLDVMRTCCVAGLLVLE